MLQEPAVRLATLEAAGQEAVPFTTGILIGALLPKLCGACSIEARMFAPAQLSLVEFDCFCSLLDP